MNKTICGDKLQIIYKHGQPKYIRDSGGILLSFPTVGKWPNQEERYREELEQAYRLADYLLKQLTDNEQIDSDYDKSFDNAADLIKHLKDQGER